MNIELTSISDNLKDFLPELVINRPFEAMVASTSYIDQSLDSFSSDVLYVLYASKLIRASFGDTTANILCIADQSLPAWFSELPNINYIYLHESVEFWRIERIFSALVQKKSSSKFEELIDALYRGKGVSAIADIGCDILGNPITILDTSYKRLATSSNLAVGDNKLLENAKIGYMDEQTIRILKSSKRLNIICQSQYPVVSGPSANHEHGVEVGYGWIDSSVRINGTVVAYFAVYGINKPFGENDAECVNQLVKLTSIELQKNEHFIQNHGVMYESLLVDLIEQRLTDQKIITNRLRSLDKTLNEDLYTVIVQKADSEKTNFQFSSGMQSSLRILIKDSISVSYKQEIVLLVSRRKDEALFSNTEDDLLPFLEQNGLRMGISNVFSNPAEMHKYYLQAKKSLELSRKLSENRLEYYSAYIIFHALEICAENIDLRDFCHPGLLKMIESPEPADQELVQTLYLYLFYMKDIPKITNELHIHKNTLFYRLKKIKTMIGEEFDEGNAVFNLMFSFKLKEYVKSFVEAN
ncbi:MAG: hypothetical protein EOM51_06370 [Clostridia bacterium]|nr:hypothetical protein [Clostridia bacterium]